MASACGLRATAVATLSSNRYFRLCTAMKAMLINPKSLGPIRRAMTIRTAKEVSCTTAISRLTHRAPLAANPASDRGPPAAAARVAEAAGLDGSAADMAWRDNGLAADLASEAQSPDRRDGGHELGRHHGPWARRLRDLDVTAIRPGKNRGKP